MRNWQFDYVVSYCGTVAVSQNRVQEIEWTLTQPVPKRKLLIEQAVCK